MIASSSHVNQEDTYICWAYAGDAACLAEGKWSDFTKFSTGFHAKCVDSVVVEVLVEVEVFEAVHFFNHFTFFLDIAVVFHCYFG